MQWPGAQDAGLQAPLASCHTRPPRSGKPAHFSNILRLFEASSCWPKEFHDVSQVQILLVLQGFLKNCLLSSPHFVVIKGGRQWHTGQRHPLSCLIRNNIRMKWLQEMPPKRSEKSRRNAKTPASIFNLISESLLFLTGVREAHTISPWRIWHTSGRFCLLGQTHTYQEGGCRGWSPLSDWARLPPLRLPQRPCFMACRRPKQHGSCTNLPAVIPAGLVLRLNECVQSGSFPPPKTDTLSSHCCFTKAYALSTLITQVHVSHGRDRWLPLTLVPCRSWGARWGKVWFASSISSSLSQSNSLSLSTCFRAWSGDSMHGFIIRESCNSLSGVWKLTQCCDESGWVIPLVRSTQVILGGLGEVHYPKVLECQLWN